MKRYIIVDESKCGRAENYNFKAKVQVKAKETLADAVKFVESYFTNTRRIVIELWNDGEFVDSYTLTQARKSLKHG